MTALEELQSTEFNTTYTIQYLDNVQVLNSDIIFTTLQNVSVTELDKVGYEEVVYTSSSLSPPAPEFEDISDEDESTDSLANTYCSLPSSVSDWNADHIMKWILQLYDNANYRYEDLNLHHFRKRDGKYLLSLTESEWQIIDKKRSKWLYDNVQKLRSTSYKETSDESCDNSPPKESPSSDLEASQSPPRRKRGRPRSLTAKRRPEQRIGRVWEFLRDLLLNPTYCPSLIYWEDYETKKFRLVDGSKVAKLWGERKKNPNMNYEKFSRTIRHYYKYKVMESVPKEKLVYRFGIKAKGLYTANPNFGFNIK